METVMQARVARLRSVAQSVRRAPSRRSATR